MERSITITTYGDGANKNSKYNYIDPDATDEAIYNAAVKIASLSNNAFVSVMVTDSYTVTAPTQNSQNRTFNNTFRR